MTDNLTTKFNTLEALLVAQHTDVLAKLDEILAALGTASGEPNDQLTAILTAIQATNTKLDAHTTLLSQMAPNLSIIRGYMPGISTFLSEALGVQQDMLNFLVSNDWCCDNTSGGEFPPNLGDTIIPDTPEKCKRAQLVVDIIINILHNIDTLLAGEDAITQERVLSFFTGEMRLRNCGMPSNAELTNMVNALTTARDARYSDMAITFIPYRAELIDALYNADTATSAWVVWQGTLSPVVGTIHMDVYQSIFYHALINCLYSEPSPLDFYTGSYSGDFCTLNNVEECLEAAATPVWASPANGYAKRWQAVFPGLDPVSTLELAPGLIASYTSPVIMTNGISGAKLHYINHRFRAVHGVSGTSMAFTVISEPGYIQLPLGINFLIIDDYEDPDHVGSGPFSVRYCPLIGGD